jgi:hypothetical protein
VYRLSSGQNILQPFRDDFFSSSLNFFYTKQNPIDFLPLVLQLTHIPSHRLREMHFKLIHQPLLGERLLERLELRGGAVSAQGLFVLVSASV